jgi:hypothetical protein
MSRSGRARYRAVEFVGLPQGLASFPAKKGGTARLNLALLGVRFFI